MLNNAGITDVNGLLESLGSGQYMPAFNVNVIGVVDVTKALIPFLRKGRGRTINTSSAVGKIALHFMGPYCMTKHAVERSSDSLRYNAFEHVLIHNEKLIV